MREKLHFSKSVMTAKFKRLSAREGYEHTKLFDEFPSAVQQELLNAIDPPPTEEAVFASVLSGESWILVTTERVVWLRDGTLNEVINVHLNEATIEPDSKRTARWKMEACRIAIATHFNETHVITVEPGSACFAILNVLLWISGRSQDYRFRILSDGTKTDDAFEVPSDVRQD